MKKIVKKISAGKKGNPDAEQGLRDLFVAEFSINI
jgi:hypothetical protein